jgi:hypothetical protein
MLGFDRTQSALFEEITRLEGLRPSAAGPNDAPAMLLRLGEIEERAQELQNDLAEAERKAHEEEERERQETAWRNRVATANNELPALRAALAEAEERQPALANELSLVIGKLQAPAEGKGKGKGGKKGKRNKETKVSDEGEEGNQRRDFDALRRRLSDDQVRLGKEIQRLSSELAALEHRATEVFTFSSPGRPSPRPSHTGGRFVPTGPSVRPVAVVPDEAIPEVGTLRTLHGQRYLVIETWEALTVGELAASRLKARLVAPENA